MASRSKAWTGIGLCVAGAAGLIGPALTLHALRRAAVTTPPPPAPAPTPTNVTPPARNAASGDRSIAAGGDLGSASTGDS
ncbi:hypothetical protein M2158_009699 [Streptomyces sp. SAI-144]|uniref:hypothetical protein n=1 Tax=unclassified Streptomyces TaxID=2593676 RepID=UPI002475A50F|nr:MULTISPECIES: hypothetical protein [unclassified Streptomyces]MDH6441158.1 hypothetical protein [Streptomyces sp. SAI-144]MDH6488476.1 hypothetical protein [Streptomyces sp. SAI-127]